MVELKESQSSNKQWQNIWKWSGLGIEFCGVVVIFCFFGYKVDQRFNTSPWFLLVGFFVGFIGMMYLIIKDTWKIWRD